ncbi:hypothetical protein LINPERHAP1_LOCUS12362 [Linum perenne]
MSRARNLKSIGTSSTSTTHLAMSSTYSSL